jgi:hypothetical protein
MFDGLGLETSSLQHRTTQGCYAIPCEGISSAQIHQTTMRNEVDRLVKAGVLKKVNINGQHLLILLRRRNVLRFISDFRQTRGSEGSRTPIPKFRRCYKTRRFAYATSIDLNMGYYHIELSPDAKNLYYCTLGQVRYQRLPMRLCNSRTFER